MMVLGERHSREMFVIGFNIRSNTWRSVLKQGLMVVVTAKDVYTIEARRYEEQ
jgi:hypothetical protein